MSKLKKELFKPLLGDWYRYFEPILESSDFYNLYQKLQNDTNTGKIIYPYSENTFKAFELCSPTNLKLIMLAQDPYPGDYKYENKLPHSDGLSFSCSNSQKGKMQPSLEYFWEGIAEEFKEDKKEYFTHDLHFLAKQGVLLGNRTLTVEKDIISSHKGLWDFFWKYFFEEIMMNFSGIPVLFIGKDSFKLKPHVFIMNNPIFELSHPSAAAKEGKLWKTNNIFSKINKLLELNNNIKINWKYNE